MNTPSPQGSQTALTAMSASQTSTQESGVGVWQPVNVNRSGRPVLGDNEQIVFIRDDVGLYQGRCKMVDRQSGRVYLTNQRVVYVDNRDVRRSVAIDIACVVKTEVIERFLRSSPKVKLYYEMSRAEDTKEAQKAPLDWVCKICSFNNHLETVDMENLPPCVSCGIPPTKKYIEQLQETATSATPEATADGIESGVVSGGSSTASRDDQCPKCTFINHPSLKFCEMCGSQLRSSVPPELLARLERAKSPVAQSGGPEIVLEGEESYSGGQKYIKLSFRTSGEVQFNDAITKVLDDIRWEKLKQSGNVNVGATRINDRASGAGAGPIKGSGIHKLQLLREQTQKQNEMTLSTSLEDLDQLMYKAQDLIKLSTSFKTLIGQKKLAAGTKISPLTISKESRFYHEELARHLSEYLINFKLTKTSSMVSIQDLFADYNRYLILSQGFGTELIEAANLNKSIELFEKLNLPVVVNTYDTGLKILRPKFNEDPSMTIVKFLKSQEIKFKFDKYKQQFFQEFDQDDYFKDNLKYFKGVSVNDVSDHFGWSIDIAMEELNRLVEAGLALIDQTIMGTFYFINKLENYSFEQEAEEDFKLEQSFKEKVIKEQQVLDEAIRQAHGETSKQSAEFSPSQLEVDPDNDPMQLELNDNEINSTLQQLSGLQFV